MKRIFLTAALIASAVSGNAFGDELPQQTIMGNNASIDLAYSAHEGESGYYLALDWQMNKYAAVSVGVDSFLNGQVFNIVETLDPDFETEMYGDGYFRPRQNTYTFELHLRYPFVFSEDTIIAPYLSLGASRMSTKALVFKPVGSESGNTVGNDTPDKRYNFEDFGAFKAGTGVQLAFSDAHKFSLGAISYLNDDNWSELVIDDNQTGVAVKYEYRPNRALGYTFEVDSVDQFGKPVLRVGINWVFN